MEKNFHFPDLSSAAGWRSLSPSDGCYTVSMCVGQNCKSQGKVYRGIRIDTSVRTKGRWDRLESEVGKDSDSKKQSWWMNVLVPLYDHDEMPEAG